MFHEETREVAGSVRFWFVDRSYRLNTLKPRLPSALRLTGTAATAISGRTIRRNEPLEIAIRTDTYEFTPNASAIPIPWCAGRGFDLFRTVFVLAGKPLSDFYQRGDNVGVRAPGRPVSESPRTVAYHHMGRADDT